MKNEMKNMHTYRQVCPIDPQVQEQKQYSVNSNAPAETNGGNASIGINRGREEKGANENVPPPNYNCESNEQTYKKKEQYEEVLNCKYCNKHVNPIITKYTPFFVYIIIVLLFFLISIFTVFLLPIIFLAFKQKKYTCPFCNKNITTTEKMFTIKKEDKILIFQCAKCAIIVSVKYLILFVLLIVLIFSFYIIRKTTNISLDHLARGPLISATWLDFLEDCGNKSQFRNRFNSVNVFKKKYYGNTVIWSGHFHHITEGLFNSNSLFIKMVPSEYKYDKPDVQMFFNNSLISKIENLGKNDYVQFECTLLDISKNRSPHLCLLWDLKLLEKYTPKNFTVIEFFKPLSILDLIYLTAPNPFFINLDEEKNAGKAVQVEKMTDDKAYDTGRLQSEEEFMIHILNHEMHTMGGGVESMEEIKMVPAEKQTSDRVYANTQERISIDGKRHFQNEDENNEHVRNFETFYFGYDAKLNEDKDEERGAEEEREEGHEHHADVYLERFNADEEEAEDYDEQHQHQQRKQTDEEQKRGKVWKQRRDEEKNNDEEEEKNNDEEEEKIQKRYQKNDEGEAETNEQGEMNLESENDIKGE